MGVGGSHSRFTSDRERALWVVAAISVAVIYASIGVARSLADRLTDSGLFEVIAVAGFGLVFVAVVTQAFRARPRAVELAVAVGVVGIALLFVARLGIDEERTHLFEYAFVGALVYSALIERRRNGRLVWAPELLAVASTATVGLVDEVIQRFVPGRFFDWRDVAFNTAAAAFGVFVAWLVGRVRSRPDR